MLLLLFTVSGKGHFMVFQLKTPVVYYTDYSHPWQYHSAGRDAKFQQVYQDSRKRNYRIGPYHYFVQGGVAQQANCLIDYMKEIGVSGPSGRYSAEFNPVLDVELECSGAAQIGKPYADMLYQWINMVEQAMQVSVDIYTAKPQWAYVLANGLAPDWIKGRRVWAKFYPYDDYIDRNVDFPLSYLPAGWTYDQVAFWQYCDHGRSAGYACNDLNKVTPAGQKYYDIRIPGTIPAPEPPPAPTVTVDIPAPGKLTMVDEKATVFTGTSTEVQDHFFTPAPRQATEAPLVHSKTVTLIHAG